MAIKNNSIQRLGQSAHISNKKSIVRFYKSQGVVMQYYSDINTCKVVKNNMNPPNFGKILKCMALSSILLL